jgi:hypothetical protein
LRDALGRARADVGTDAEVARLAAKLGPLLGPAPLAATAVGKTAGHGVAAKLGAFALALLAAGGAVWMLSAPSGTVTGPPAPVPPVPSASAPGEALVPPPVVPPPVLSGTEPPPLPTASGPLTPPKTSLAVPSEADLLERARAALKSGDSARALQRTNEHAQRYPRGVLVQEREVLAIRALRGLGRDAEADRRAEAFAKAYPGSAFQRKVPR